MIVPATFRRIRATFAAGLITARRADVATQELRQIQKRFACGLLSVGGALEEVGFLSRRHNLI